MSVLSQVKSHLYNLPGWRTNRKIVVFESDDWGMIRMASEKAYHRLLQKGYPVDQCIYNSNDALEGDSDLTGLMEVLDSVRDKNDAPARFTLNNIVANPDFEKIRANKFQEYHYESFPTTLQKYPNSEKVLELYEQGIESKLFQVQFHGREHVHINNWLSALRSKKKLFLDAFDENMFTQYKGKGSNCKYECLDAMAAYNQRDEEVIIESIQEGLSLFQSIWGFSSKSLIAPCYTWRSSLERELNKLGINHIQGGRAQREPKSDRDKKLIKRHFTGQKSRSGSVFLVRNVYFEQAENPNIDWVDSAMKEIDIAFKWKKPAIISTHRVNYIGRINPSNRDRNLETLSKLLKKLVQTWPDVEFMSTDNLGELILKNH